MDNVYGGDPESLYLKAPSTGTAYFAVDSTGSSGKFEVTLEEFTLPTNATCANAETITLTGGKGSAIGDTGLDLAGRVFHADLRHLHHRELYLDGPQAYYQVGLKANPNYLFYPWPPRRLTTSTPTSSATPAPWRRSRATVRAA